MVPIACKVDAFKQMYVSKVLFVALLFSFEHNKRESSVLDRISWNLLTKPVVFKRDVQLECHISTKLKCCNEFTRKWSRGKSYDLIVMNGVSLNTAKYKEYLNISANISTLTIYSFNEYDVNIPYECSYGFISDSKILELTEENFEYHPEETLPYNLTSNEQQVCLNITLTKVYPAPICTAMDGIKDVTNNLFVKSDENGLLLQSNILFNYTINYVCHTTVKILCKIGQAKFAVVNGSRPCIKEKTGFPLSLIVTVILASCSIIVILSITILLMNCRSENKNENEPTNRDDNYKNSEIDETDDVQQPENSRLQELNVLESQKMLTLEPKVVHKYSRAVPNKQYKSLRSSFARAENIENIELVETSNTSKRKLIKKKR